MAEGDGDLITFGEARQTQRTQQAVKVWRLCFCPRNVFCTLSFSAAAYNL